MNSAVGIKPRAVFKRLLHTERERLPANVFSELAGYIVIAIEHRARKRVLVQKYIFLRLNIFVHILMNIKVIGRYVGNYRHVGAFAHRYKLK